MKHKPIKKEEIHNIQYHRFLLSLLKETYPIKRIKNNGKFQRGIIIHKSHNNTVLFLSKNKTQMVVDILTQLMYDLIGTNPTIYIMPAVYDYLYG